MKFCYNSNIVRVKLSAAHLIGAYLKIWPYLGIFAFLIFIGLDKDRYLLFHTTVETFSVVVSVALIMLVWNARKLLNNNFLIFLSIIYCFVGILNFFHLLSYRGMPFFINYGDTISSQVWIATRYLLAASLPVPIALINRKINETVVSVIYAIITAALWSSIFIFRVFPVTFVAGSGLTLFKIVSEYIICALFLLSAYLIYRSKWRFDKTTYQLLFTSFLLNALAGVLFTLYFDLTGFIMVIAHIVFLFSYYLVYKAVIEVGLMKPYNLLFMEIQNISKRKDELLNITSHELKNPLTNIKVYSQLLGKRMSDCNQANNNSLIINQIQYQADKINRIVSDLSDVGRIETGHMILNKDDVELCPFINDLVKEFRLLYPNYKFILSVTPEITANCDKERINQVLANLVTNAIKYSPEFSTVEVKYEVKPREIIFSVRDEGAGISPKNKANIFDKYFRASGDKSGMGLGLYISKEIVEQHNGRMWFETKSGKGSVFYFSLPRVS